MNARRVERHGLVGTWKLVSWEGVADDGSFEQPIGARPDGLLVYTDEGTMLVMLTGSDRPRHSGSDLTGSTPEERAEAARTFIAYGGRYEVEGSQVVHHVEMSLFPNWVGSRQVRHVEMDTERGQMTLTSPPIAIGGSTRHQRLVWERRGLDHDRLDTEVSGHPDNGF